MTDPSPKDIFLHSLETCASNEKFIPAFYEHFLSTSDEVRDKFESTDFENLHKMLIRSLTLAANATSGERHALSEIRERAETHDRHHLNIEPRLYDYWLNSLMSTAQDFDDKWDQSTEDAWKTTLGHVIKHMVNHY
ncbi:hypothetical protein BH10ACI2_BH10ACI2_02460 [soil metagenome]